MSNLLVADQRRCIKETFGDLITTMDRRIPEFEAAEKAYEEAKQELRDEVKRIKVGLEKYDEADSSSRKAKISEKLREVAEKDVGRALAYFIERFLDLVQEYGE